MADSFPLTIPPNIIQTVSTVFDTNTVRFERGAEQRSPKRHNGKHKWKISWNVMTLNEFAILQAHFEDRKGSLKTFTITDDRLGTEAITVKFSEDMLSFEKFKHAYGDVSTEIETL